MKLSELATESGVTTASIKYYIHAGILPPGAKKNATTAVYGETHLHRLALIMWLRAELSAPIESIADLTRAIDDPDLSTVDLMGMCQEFALRTSAALPASALPDQDLVVTAKVAEAGGSPAATAVPPRREVSNPAEAVGSPAATGAETGTRTGAVTGAGDGGTAEPPRRYEEIVTEALARLGWPDENSAARLSLERTLEATEAAGYTVSVDTTVEHCRALTEIARTNISPIGLELSRDEVCLHVIRGITVHNRQLIATSALAHAALSIMAREPQE